MSVVKEVQRQGGASLWTDEHGKLYVDNDVTGDSTVELSPADLHWIVTAGGPAMLALLGGPLSRVEE